MMGMTRKRSLIYRSRLHVLATVFFLLLPFAFFFFYAQLTSLSTGDLFSDVLVSCVRMIVAYVIAAVLGWVMAVAFYSGRRALVALPLFDVLQSFPTFAALPLAVLKFGNGNTTVIFFLMINILWPVFFTIISSLKLSKHEWKEAMQIYQVRGWQYVKQYLLPVTIPGLITGSIIGLGDGWEALVATEMIVAPKKGMGVFFQAFSNNPTITALGIFGLLLLIFVVNKLLWLPLLEWSHRTMEA